MQQQLLMTVHEAKRLVRDGRRDGVACPCCGQFCKVYRRAITSPMARWLIRLVRAWEDKPKSTDYVNVHDIATSAGGDHAKLAHWELIQQRPKDPDDTEARTSGFWRPTSRGVQFIHRPPVQATWALSLYADCPNCREYVDLLDVADFFQDRDLDPCENMTPRSRSVEVDCPECDHGFQVTCVY